MSVKRSTMASMRWRKRGPSGRRRPAPSWSADLPAGCGWPRSICRCMPAICASFSVTLALRASSASNLFDDEIELPLGVVQFALLAQDIRWAFCATARFWVFVESNCCMPVSCRSRALICRPARVAPFLISVTVMLEPSSSATRCSGAVSRALMSSPCDCRSWLSTVEVCFLKCELLLETADVRDVRVGLLGAANGEYPGAYSIFTHRRNAKGRIPKIAKSIGSSGLTSVVVCCRAVCLSLRAI
ncbi:hypothetical protein ABIF81_001681 [Bradyrhizobium daqingense]